MLRTTIRKIFTFTIPPLYYFMLSTLRGFLSQLCPCRKMECRQNTSRFPSLLSSLWGPRRSQQSLSVSTSTQTQTQPPAPAPAPKIDIASTLQKKRSAEQDRVSRETAQKELVDEIENLVGLENVKRQLLGVQNWVQICRRHGREPRNEWYNIVFQGNPGTGELVYMRHDRQVPKLIEMIS